MTTERFRLCAFVCDKEEVVRPDHEGWMTPHQIWMERDAGCRYAIVDVREGGAQLWDLFHPDWDAWLSDEAQAIPPGHAFTDIDAAIAAAVMRYKQGFDRGPA